MKHQLDIESESDSLTHTYYAHSTRHTMYVYNINKSIMIRVVVITHFTPNVSFSDNVFFTQIQYWFNVQSKQLSETNLSILKQWNLLLRKEEQLNTHKHNYF